MVCKYTEREIGSRCLKEKDYGVGVELPGQKSRVQSNTSLSSGFDSKVVPSDSSISNTSCQHHHNS